MAGIKETREVLAFTKLLAVFIAERLSDGAGLDDLYALVQKAIGDSSFQKAAADAWSDSSLIPKEIADLDAVEISLLGKDGIDLVAAVIMGIQKKVI